MWKFRPIGKYYELLVDDDNIYLCRKQDTIIQAVIEDLCNKHNDEIAKYENLDVEIASCMVRKKPLKNDMTKAIS